ncbi:hypothetical protein LDG_7041 [Legionella drancourtii LLAP12]|uniref:Uncharacterized protein n=1 Tax=Legionella drancourtii LLAP12 TaxID=658187 RepID=G9EP60_9GAMM|nr:hypothetical protein LDG_7041 [Legionella drancourtii LLAP12]
MKINFPFTYEVTIFLSQLETGGIIHRGFFIFNIKNKKTLWSENLWSQALNFGYEHIEL